jgi:hypothetical protein
MPDATNELPAKPAWRERALDAAGVAFVALFGLKLSWDLSLVRDVGLNDEAIYMASGV